MRRGVASLIMGLSLLVATASWAGFVMSHTVLDPGRSERLADHLLDNPEVRAVIVDRIADAMELQVPPSVPVTRQSLELAASIALDDPRVESLVRDGIVQAHQNALNGVDEPVMLDATVVGDAARDALVAEIPATDLLLPEAPALEVEVPATGLSWLGTVKSYVDRYTLLGALVALVGVIAAFVLARNRPAALRRVAFWALASSAFWIGVGYAVPSIARTLAPSSAAIASAAVDVFFGAMLRPAVVLAGAGVALLILSFLWPAYERRRPAALVDQGARPRGEGRRRGSGPAPRSSPVPAGWSPEGSAEGGWGQAPPTPTVVVATASGYGPAPTAPPLGPGPPASLDPTAEYPLIASSAEAATRVMPGSGPAAGPPAGWVEGVGYVDPAARYAGPPGTTPSFEADTQPAPAFDDAPTVAVPIDRSQLPGR